MENLPRGNKFTYTEDDRLIITPPPVELTGAAAEEYAALERVWEARAALEKAELELAQLRANVGVDKGSSRG